MESLMDLVSFILKTMIILKEYLLMVDVKDREELLSQMEAIMKVKLKITKLTGMGNMKELMDINIKGNGKIIYLMVMVKPAILIQADILVNF